MATQQTVTVRPDIIQSYIDKFNIAAVSNPTLIRHTRDSLDWFRKRVSKDLRKNRYDMIRNPGQYRKRTGRENKTLIGRLFYFHYEAVQAGDKVNGVYDAFPMVFVFNTSKSGEGKNLIHALNVHYLLPRERAKLYLNLMQVLVNPGWTYRTKLRLSWNIIQSYVKDPHIYERAVHTYRVDRLQSRMIEIYPEEWEIAVFLRLEQWIHVDTKTTANQAGIRKNRRGGKGRTSKI